MRNWLIIPFCRRSLAYCIGIAVTLGVSSLAAQETSYRVDTVAALRAVSSSSYHRVLVAGYFAARDGGGGQYTYDSSDTTSSDNGGTIIVAADGARWKLTQTEPVSVTQFGAVLGTSGDNAPAIQAALNACAVVWVTPGVYRCDESIVLNDENALIGQGARGDASSAAVTSGAKLVFYGSGDGCLESSTTQSLCYAAIKDLAVNADASSSYSWLMHFTEPVALDLTDVQAGTSALGTGGIKCNVRAEGGGVSWMNNWHNVQVMLPAYTGSGSAPSATAASLDVDFSDSQILAGGFVGGTGVFLRGTGPIVFTQVSLSGSVGNNLTIEHDTPGSASADHFVNCLFDTPYSGEVLVNLDGEDSDVPNVSPQFVGCAFNAPGLSVPLVTVQNLTGPAQTNGGVFANNVFTANPAAVFSLAYGGAGWTLAHNRYATAPDFSSLTAASIYEDTEESLPGAVVIGGSLVTVSQAAPAATLTGTTAETALASIPIPANSLGASGKLRISATFSVNSSTYAKTARIRFGNALAGTAFYVGAISGSSTLIHTTCEISMCGATNSEISAHGQDATGPGVSGNTGAAALVTGTVDTTANQTLVLSGSLANAADAITLQQYTVESLQP